MKKKTTPKLIIACIICALFSITSILLAQTTIEKIKAAATSLVAPSTVENLQKAYDGESNAHARYVEFAKKADEEGYQQVASLFRAAAAAEEVHINNIGETLKSLNQTPSADIKPVTAGTTRENLQAAIDGENHEVQTMYPEYMEQAQKENIGKAEKTFKWAKDTEEIHSKYFQEALDNLESWKEGKKDFLVCTNCGYTTTDTEIRICPECSYPRDKINLVN